MHGIVDAVLNSLILSIYRVISPPETQTGRSLADTEDDLFFFFLTIPRLLQASSTLLPAPVFNPHTGVKLRQALGPIALKIW